MRVLRRHVSRRLFWAFVASIFIHFAIGAALVALLLFHRQMRAGLPDETVAISTTLRIMHRPPPRVAATPRPQPPVQKPLPEPQRPVRQAAPPPRELARIQVAAPRSQPLPRAPVHVRTTLDLAQQQADFEKTIARLRRQNDPVASVEHSVRTSDSVKRYVSDFSESIGSAPHGEGILYPVDSWHADGYDYYYVRYWVQYPDGTSENGVVPWPLRYLPGQDPFRLGIQHFPLPAPLADYTLPAGTSLHPLVAYCYEHRGELSSCPIYHD